MLRCRSSGLSRLTSKCLRYIDVNVSFLTMARAPSTQLHSRLRLLHSRLCLLHSRLCLLHSRLHLLHSRLRLLQIRGVCKGCNKNVLEDESRFMDDHGSYFRKTSIMCVNMHVICVYVMYDDHGSYFRKTSITCVNMHVICVYVMNDHGGYFYRSSVVSCMYVYNICMYMQWMIMAITY